MFCLLLEKKRSGPRRARWGRRGVVCLLLWWMKQRGTGWEQWSRGPHFQRVECAPGRLRDGCRSQGPGNTRRVREGNHRKAVNGKRVVVSSRGRCGERFEYECEYRCTEYEQEATSAVWPRFQGHFDSGHSAVRQGSGLTVASCSMTCGCLLLPSGFVTTTVCPDLHDLSCFPRSLMRSGTPSAFHPGDAQFR